VSQTGVLPLHPALAVHVLQVPWSHTPVQLAPQDAPVVASPGGAVLSAAASGCGGGGLPV
jgi:hypothetical protein